MAIHYRLHELLQRCSGRSTQHRRQTLLRLLRVQRLIRRHNGLIGIERLARDACYSPGHLMRLYRDVFGESPSEHAVRLRSDHAWRMVRDTRMPVGAITAALGYESPSTFCRAFKQAFGVTVTEARCQCVGNRQAA